MCVLILKQDWPGAGLSQNLNKILSFIVEKYLLNCYAIATHYANLPMQYAAIL